MLVYFLKAGLNLDARKMQLRIIFVQAIDVLYLPHVLFFRLPLKEKLILGNINLRNFIRDFRVEYVVLLYLLPKSHSEGKYRSFTKSALKLDVTSKLLHDVLRNDESKTNTTGVKLLLILDKAKKLEQLCLVFLFDSNSWVNHFHL